MKKLFILAMLVVAMALPASAQFSWGPKVGVAVNDLHFNKNIVNDVLSSENQAGFTGGLMAEFMLPIANLGFDASVMYVRRNAKVKVSGTNEAVSDNRDYIELPINLKWKIGIPVVGKIITPYLFTGPSFAFLVSKKEIGEFFENKSCDVAWNFGLGLQLFTKLQIGASYGLGMSNSLSSKLGVNATNEINGKNKFWTVTSAYLF